MKTRQYIAVLSAILFLMWHCSALQAQAPAEMSYQAVIRNAANELVKNQQVGTSVSILQGSASGAVVFSETHSRMTNENGLLTFEIGNGTPVSGSIDAIDWADGPYFIQTETDPSGGSNYSISTVTKLMSVPYALHAHTAAESRGSASGDLTGQYPAPEIRNARVSTAKLADGAVTAPKLNRMGAADGEVLMWNAGSWAPERPVSRNMLPIAYGTISNTGDIFSGSGNFTVQTPAVGTYEITIANEPYFFRNYVTLASLIGGSGNAGFIEVTSAANKLMVYTKNTSGTATEKSFHFIVYKP